MRLAGGRAWIAIAVYAGFVFSVLNWTPLWLDELQQLGGRQITYHDLFRWSELNAGASPFPYFLQRAILNAAGVSSFTARIPAAVCSILAAIVFAMIIRRLNLKRGLLALCLFLAVPLQFRYALEARVYSQGLLFSVVSLWLFLRLRERPNASRAALYALSIAAGLYSQPLTLFPALAQAAWAMCCSKDLRLKIAAAAAAGAGVLLFVPWFLTENSFQHRMGATSLYFFSVHQIRPLTLLHEMTGGGYVCTAAILILIGAAGFGRRLCWIMLACSIAGPIVADAVFHYFFAARQLLFAIPAMTLLAAEGAGRLARISKLKPLPDDRGSATASWTRDLGRFAAYGLLAAFFASAALKDYSAATVPKDELAATADAIAARLSSGVCVGAAPQNQIAYYVFFRPELAGHDCAQMPGAERLLIVNSAYTSPEDRTSAAVAVPAHYSQRATVRVGHSEIAVYGKTSGS